MAEIYDDVIHIHLSDKILVTAFVSSIGLPWVDPLEGKEWVENVKG